MEDNFKMGMETLNHKSRNRVNKKMPKIDTLDALEDEMTSILNTL